MNTAVQLRPIAARDMPRCDLIFGQPREVVIGKLGRIALFAPGALVAYRLRSRRRVRLYIFRSLGVRDPLAAEVPGVWPQVQLLVHLCSAGRVRLARSLFGCLTQAGIEPARVPDDFYLRMGVVLAGRVSPPHAPDLDAAVRSCLRRSGTTSRVLIDQQEPLLRV